MEESELRAIVEGILFMSDTPVSVERLSDVLEGIAKDRVLTALTDLEASYRQSERGVQIVQVAGGYQMVTRPEIAPWLKRLDRIKSAARLSKPSLESLAIVAYRQPVTRAEIEEIRGVDSSGVLRTLADRRLIKIVGRKEIVGRPMMYGTTREFLQYFGLSNLSALPTLRELPDVAPEPEEASEAVLPSTSPDSEAVSVDPADSSKD